MCGPSRRSASRSSAQPTVANWDGFLRQHKLQYLLAGLLARVTPLFVAGNLLLLGAHLLAALSFFAAARYLRARQAWAIGGALLFAFSRFMYFRGLGHLTVATCWPIPLALVTIAWCAGRRPLHLRSRRFAAALGVTVLVGLHNIYFAALYVQFLVLAGLVRAARLRRCGELRLPLLLAAVLLSTVVVDNANQVVDRVRSGPGAAALVRPYGNSVSPASRAWRGSSCEACWGSHGRGEPAPGTRCWRSATCFSSRWSGG